MATDQPVRLGASASRDGPAPARPWTFPIGSWLALATTAILIVVLIGNRLAQERTHTTAEYVTRVEQRFGPLAVLARELGDALAAFDRAVFAYLKFDTAADSAGTLDGASQTLLTALADYERAGQPATEGAPKLADEIRTLREKGHALVEQQRRQRVAIAEYWSFANSMHGRIERAAGGVQVGDTMLARKSLADLGIAAERMRALAAVQFSQREARAVDAAARAEVAFRSLLQEHAEEIGRSPGIAWLELVREDALLAARARRSVAKLDAELDSARRDFGASAEAAQKRVYAELQEPAWGALSASTRQARVTAQEAERLIGRLSLAALLVILLVSSATAFGVILPVRRLMEGTRRLAAGALSTRVPRGGMRELDALAASFNHMASQLAESEQVVRSYQARLEDRVAQRTRQLRHLAHHDPLTELPNRRQLFSYLNAAIEQTIADGRRLAVLFVDVDHFKTLNDSLGHDFGDRVLRAMSRRLREFAGPDQFIARLGADEFTLVIANAGSTADVEDRVTQLIAEFQRPLEVEQRELLVGVSVGFALCPGARRRRTVAAARRGLRGLPGQRARPQPLRDPQRRAAHRGHESFSHRAGAAPRDRCRRARAALSAGSLARDARNHRARSAAALAPAGRHRGAAPPSSCRSRKAPVSFSTSTTGCSSASLKRWPSGGVAMAARAHRGERLGAAAPHRQLRCERRAAARALRACLRNASRSS